MSQAKHIKVEELLQTEVTVEYHFYSKFKLPIGVRLLCDKENTENKPFSWWIKYDILSYYDENMKIVEVKPSQCWEDDISSELKNPADIYVKEHSLTIDEIEDDNVEVYADDDNGVPCRWTLKDGWVPVDE